MMLILYQLLDYVKTLGEVCGKYQDELSADEEDEKWHHLHDAIYEFLLITLPFRTRYILNIFHHPNRKIMCFYRAHLDSVPVVILLSS